jgi:hypothetical protein
MNQAARVAQVKLETPLGAQHRGAQHQAGQQNS